MTSPYADTVNRPSEHQSLKVRSDTNPGSLGRSIQLTLMERAAATPDAPATLSVRAMGPQPVNQMAKGIAIARQNLLTAQRDLCAQFHFESHTEAGASLSVIVATLTLVTP